MEDETGFTLTGVDWDRKLLKGGDRVEEYPKKLAGTRPG